MDKQRDPAILKRKKRNRMLAAVVVGLAVVALTVAVSRLEPAAPSVADSESVLYFGTVKRGPFTREVRGAGTLVPEEIRWITATTTGRVERLVLQPGASVEPGTVILELSNLDLQQSFRSAELDLQTALANMANQKATVSNARLTQEASIVDFESAYEVALADLQTNQSLAETGLVSRFTVRQKQAAVDRAKNQLELARKQLASSIESSASQLAPTEAAVNQRRAEVDRLRRQLDDLRVKSTMSGQLQMVSVEVGASVAPGAQLARVSDPTRLKAVVRISETQTRDLSPGQLADIDTRNGHVKGKVTRIDPASSAGHGRRGRHARGPAAGRRPPRPRHRRHDRARATDERALRREPRLRAGEQHDQPVQGSADTRGSAHAGEDRPAVGAVRRGGRRPRRGRPGGPLGHVSVRQLRPASIELTTGTTGSTGATGPRNRLTQAIFLRSELANERERVSRVNEGVEPRVSA